MFFDRDSPDGLHRGSATAILEETVTTEEVAQCCYRERPWYSVSFLWSTLIVSVSPHAETEPEHSEAGLVELMLGTNLSEVSLRVAGVGYDRTISWPTLCSQTDESKAVRMIAGKRIVTLLRLAYHWQRASWFKPVAVEALCLFLQKLR